MHLPRCHLWIAAVFCITTVWLVSTTYADSDLWQCGGPFGGYVQAMARATSDPDVVYAAVSYGVYLSEDFGASWTKLRFPTYHEIRDIATAPDDAYTVYVATEHGIYKCESFGGYWTDIGLDDVTALAISPDDPDMILAGAAGGNAGIYLSLNGGDTWELKYDASVYSVSTLLFDPDSSGHVYAGLSRSSGPGFLKSTDGGITWGATSLAATVVYEIAMSAAGSVPPVIYAMTKNDIYRSIDLGLTWVDTDAPFISAVGPYALAVDPVDPEIVYAGTKDSDGDVCRSIDGGIVWEIKADGFNWGNPSEIIVHPTTRHLLVGLAEGGVYRSTNYADDWLFSSVGMINTGIQSIEVHPDSANIIWAGSRGEGHRLAKSVDGGLTWQHGGVSTPSGVRTIYTYPANPSNVYVGFGTHVYKSSNGGSGWSPVNAFFYEEVRDVWVNPDYEDHMLVATYRAPNGNEGLYRSLDGGHVFYQPINMWACMTIACDPLNPWHVFVGTREAGYVLDSYDGGLTWGYFSPTGDWVDRVYDIEVDMRGNVYVGTDEGPKLYIDGLWREPFHFSSTKVYDVAVDTLADPPVIYIGTWGSGLRFSADGGVTWEQFADDPFEDYIYSLDIGYDSVTYLYVGTVYNGVWRRPVYRRPGIELSTDSLLFQLIAGESAEQSFTISNSGPSGAADMRYSITEQGFSFETQTANKFETPVWNVLLLTTEYYVPDIFNELNAFAGITMTLYPVDSLLYLNIADLMPYEVILTATVVLGFYAEVVGDVLADYIDYGGKVIVTNSGFDGDPGWHIEGRFMDEQYGPFELSTTYFVDTQTMFSAGYDHELLEGVTGVGTTELIYDCGLAPGAESIAYWRSGHIFAAMNDDVLAVNIVIISSWAGDLPQFLANAIDWFGSQSPDNPYLSLAPDCDTLPGGTEQSIVVTANAVGPGAGIATTELLVFNNVTGDEPLVITVTLDIRTDVGDGDSDPGPINFCLMPNHPNPFNATTVIEFDLPHRSHVELVIYNIIGQRVCTLVDEEFSAGTHRAVWDGRSDSGERISSGVYLYKLTADQFVDARKMVLLK